VNRLEAPHAFFVVTICNAVPEQLYHGPGRRRLDQKIFVLEAKKGLLHQKIFVLEAKKGLLTGIATYMQHSSVPFLLQSLCSTDVTGVYPTIATRECSGYRGHGGEISDLPKD
jgi:hypothetical protein